MSHNGCARHGKEHPCTCAMGNIYRFLEPVLLFLLKQEGQSYGYQLADHLKENALTDAEIEGAAMYRTLRRLEQNGYVRSTWNVNGSGPARRVYSLTRTGDEHLREWTEVLANLSDAMVALVRKVRSLDRRNANLKSPRSRG